jgi:hypothetical protein
LLPLVPQLSVNFVLLSGMMMRDLRRSVLRFAVMGENPDESPVDRNGGISVPGIPAMGNAAVILTGSTAVGALGLPISARPIRAGRASQSVKAAESGSNRLQ